MKKQTSIFLLIFVAATFPLMAFGPQSAPLYATALVSGRTYDQAHSTGYIDWTGSVLYKNLYHEDWTTLPPSDGGTSCLSGCTEKVTRINDGGIVSGRFSRDVTYFEAMLAYEWTGSGVGTATIKACAATRTQNLKKSSSSPAGFNSFSLVVPAGCRTWSVKASAGFVHIRSVDVEYVAATPTATSTRTYTPTSTRTPTPTNTSTHTPTVTATNVPPSTYTFTPTFTQTSTATVTATDTLIPTETPTATETGTLIPTETPTATETGTLIPTETPTATATGTRIPTHTPTSTVTATGTLVPTHTPTKTATATAIPTIQQTVVIIVPNIIINNNNTNTNTVSGGGSGSSSFTALTPAPMQGQGGSMIWGTNVCGGYYIRARVYVDDNQDKLMSPAEGVTALQLFLLDQTYARLGSAHTLDGHAAFCIPPVQYGKPVYIDIPYLQLFKSVQIPEQPDQDLEIWFPGDPPILPLYLP